MLASCRSPSSRLDVDDDDGDGGLRKDGAHPQLMMAATDRKCCVRIVCTPVQIAHVAVFKNTAVRTRPKAENTQDER